LNLGANALQAMAGRQNKKIFLRAKPARHSEIEESAAKLYTTDETDAPGVIFEVKDNGWGINAEAQANIFEPFFSTKSGGTGLGLAVVARIIQGHGGVVVFRSELDQGTSFRLWFPFKYDKPTGETGMIRI
jgi:signal transduction histidine kinase